MRSYLKYVLNGWGLKIFGIIYMREMVEGIKKVWFKKRIIKGNIIIF